MRTASGPELTRLNATHTDLYLKVEVKDADATYRDLTNLSSTDWVDSVSWSEAIDRPVSTGTIELRRDTNALSLAPFIQASTLNRNGAGAYAPLLELNRDVRISTALVDHAASPAGGDWKEVFRGRIDEIHWETSPARLQISDIGARLMDAMIETESTYGTVTGDPVEDQMQLLIDTTLGAGVVTLNTPVSPGWNIFEYKQQREPLLVALQNLALQIGWDVRYRYDASNNFLLTFYEPDRAKTTADATIGPTTYRSVNGLSRAIADIRNVVKVVYSGGSVTRSNTASITKYGRRFMEIANAPNIDDGAEATDMGQAAVDDLSEPIADQEIETLYWWPAQLGDLYTFTANGDHYDVDQKLAVVNVDHHIAQGEGITRLQTRGTVSGAFRNWLRIGGTGTGGTTGADIFQSLSQTPDYGANTVTFAWLWSGDPTATFNLYREFNTVTSTPVAYVLQSGGLAAGTDFYVFSTGLVDIDSGGASQCNIGFYLEAIIGATVVAVSVKNEVVYQRN